MAYLKGDTYIDGDLNVKGKLFIQRLADGTTGLGMPYLENEDSAISNRLVKFATTDGGLTSSLIEETLDVDGVIYKFLSTGEATTILDFSSKALNLDNAKSMSITTQVSSVKIENSTLIPLERYTGSGTPNPPYYSEGGVYYTKWSSTEYRNHPVKFCYEAQMVGSVSGS